MKKSLFITSLLVLSASCSHNAHHVQKSSSTIQAGTRNAIAQLKVSSEKNLKGVVEFTEENGKVTVITKVDGLTTGTHGFHIHEIGDCSKADFTSAGGHFNPSKAEHGALNAEKNHAGDLGNLIADRSKKAYTTIQTHGVTLGEGENSIIGKAVIIHKDADDYKTQPTGNAGGRLACGVIELVK